MNIRYWFLLAATAAGLASCSSNSGRPEETAQTTAAPPPGSAVVPDTVAATGTLTPTVSDTTDSGPVEAAHLPESRQPADGAESRPLRRPRYGRRTPTTLADAPTVDNDDDAPATEADSAAVADLGRFLATGLPPARQFVIRPGRDTVLVGPQDTQILLPARIWDLPAADSNAVVRLDMQEFYTAADMVLAGLSTTAGPDLLETGGMLRLTATTNGRPVQLRPGSRVYLRMPTKKAKPGMQLFEGITDGHQQAVDWQLPGSVPSAAGTVAGPKTPRRALRRRMLGPAQHFDSTYVEHPYTQWPEKKGFENQLRAQLPKPGRLRRNRDNIAQSKEVLNNLSQAYDERIVRYVSVNFTVDSTGAMEQFVPRQGSDPELTPSVCALLLHAERWKPAGLPHYRRRQLVYEPMAATSSLQVSFARSGKIFIMPSNNWSLPRAGKARARQLKHEVDSLLAIRSFRRQLRFTQDSLEIIRRGQVWARYQAEQARLRTQFTDTSRAAITAQGVYNELSAQGMSWINCDRFVQGLPRISLRVASLGKGAITSLIFKEINAVMRGEEEANNTVGFGNVPAQVQATVVAIRREAGITYLATRTLLTGEAPVRGLAFHPVTMAQLRAELAALN
ncbi:MAG: hypothetical protein M3Y54_17920 [Bacteroidota bacterium]|nr:hypothetical protein [Bacteroidota bacterium]